MREQTERALTCFDLEQICRSGQCFRMERLGECRYSLLAGSRYLELAQKGNQVIFFCGEGEWEQVWRPYFDLDRNYEEVIARINPRDLYLTKAAELGSGIRILKQDPWEMIVTFLISQQNNIPRIRRCIERLCQEYGEPLGHGRFGFPVPQALEGLAEEKLKECGLGYRSRYVVRAARTIASGGMDLQALEKMSYPRAREQLLTLFGVGDKVADCVCLFGLHHLQAFPVDTHIRQALDMHYKRGFPHRRYRGIQGILQQYMFYYELYGDGNEKK